MNAHVEPALMAYDVAAMHFLANCHLDRRTIANVRDMVPSLRGAGTYDAEQVDAAVDAFEARVARAEAAGEVRA